MTPKLCECGCGLPAPIAKVTRTPLGHVRGQPIRFIKGHQTHLGAPNRLSIQPGTRFGRWTIEGEAAPSNTNLRRVTARCDCGRTKVVLLSSLRHGVSQSCGCLQREATVATHTIHGQARKGHVAALFRAWQAMIQRCINPKNKRYRHYGGRGIKVCDRWLNSYAVFAADVGPRPSPTHSIDRINNDGNYEPGNVRWATPSEQSKNRRRWTIRQELTT
jgi:hypothetical protein